MYRLRRHCALATGVLLLAAMAGCSSSVPQAAELTGLTPAGELTDEQVLLVLGEEVVADAELESDVASAAESQVETPPDALEETPDLALDDVAAPDQMYLEGPRGGPQLVLYGTYAGRFAPDPNRPRLGGSFRGRWIAEPNRPSGTFRGAYRVAEPNQLPPELFTGGTFQGEWADPNRPARGAIRGRWGVGRAGQHLIFGRLFDAAERPIGALTGRWVVDPNSPGGPIGGRWVVFHLCSELETFPDVPFDAADFGGLEPTDEPIAVQEAGSVDASGGADADKTDAAQLQDPPCIDPNAPHGFLDGLHIRDPNAPRTGGHIRGQWFNRNHRPIGVLVGRYEPVTGDRQALGRLYMKRLSPEGRFLGYVRGYYGKTATGLGVFRGHYLSPRGEDLGQVLGRWTDAPDRPGGPFDGIWFGTETDVP